METFHMASSFDPIVYIEWNISFLSYIITVTMTFYGPNNQMRWWGELTSTREQKIDRIRVDDAY